MRARASRDPVRVVFDVGAAVGDKARTFLRTFPDARLYCFEPQALARERCAKRIAPWRGRVEQREVGLYNENRSPRLKVGSYSDARSLLGMQPFVRHQGNREGGLEPVTL